MIIAQLSDLHVSTENSRYDRNWRTSEKTARAVISLNEFTPAIDMVVISGDLIEGGTREEYDRLRDILADLQAPFYLMVGNHDSRDNLRAVFPDHDYLRQDPEFVQYSVAAGPLELIMLDTLIPGEPGGILCEKRLEWLDRTLARGHGRPTIIFMHHPPFRTGLARMDAMGFSNPDDLAAVLEKYQHVERVMCGHLHRPIQKRFANTMSMTAPSVCHQLELNLAQNDRLAITLEPPAYLLHAWLGTQDGLVTHTCYVGDHSTTVLGQLGRK